MFWNSCWNFVIEIFHMTTLKNNIKINILFHHVLFQ
nr:MAG TPA: hypothetical protein [Caudoviricetes sp.]